MAADITRSTFDRLKHYTGVRQQQGRVSMDADWNEQVDISTYRAQTEAADVIGRCGAPRDNAGFEIQPLPQQGNSSDLAILPGRIYVDGILCELESSLITGVQLTAPALVQLPAMTLDGHEFVPGQWVEFSAQDATAPPAVQLQIQSVNAASQTLTLAGDLSAFIGKTGMQLRRIATYLTQLDCPSPAPLPTTGLALAYLDVWERSVTALEDSGIRDPALGSAGAPDTATRTKTIWQLKLQPVALNSTCATAPDFAAIIPPRNAQLAARSEPTAAAGSACILPPRAGYRRLENQLYRVEIHSPGTVASNSPSFKWSRDNASVSTAIVSPAPTLSGATLSLNVSSLGRDQVLGFASGQWVELLDDARELQGRHGILVQLTGAVIGPQGPVLTADASLSDTADLNSFLTTFSNQTVRNAKVRRWDQSGAQVNTTAPGGDIKIQEGTWLDLESGVQIFFQPGATYSVGDYWLIPARTVTGDVDWPRDSAGTPQPLPPRGIQHHYCRLGILDFSTPNWSVVSDCRPLFPPQADRGMRITFVFMTNASPVSPNGGLLLNDGLVSLQDLAGGVSVVCDTPVDPVSLVANPSVNNSQTKPTCFVTIDVPSFSPNGQSPFAAQSMVVAATLGVDQTGNTITWTPTPAASTWLQNQLPLILAQTPPPGPLLAHLTLKGNYIWARGNPSLYLDGEAFGGPADPDSNGNRRTAIFLPGGDGRRGGDFNAWFWLVSLSAVVVSPASLDFGNQPVAVASTPATLTLTNNGKTTLTISGIVAAGDFTQTTTCPAATAPLPAGASCTINVTFTPSQPGLRAGTITVTHNAPGSPLIIPLTGTGLSAALLASATTLIFSHVLGGNTERNVTLTNTGSAPLTISAITLSGGAAGDYAVSGPCVPAGAPTVIKPGLSCTLTVGFAPRALGARLAAISIVHNAPGSPLIIALNGRGITPPPPRSGGIGGGVLNFKPRPF